MSFDNNNNNNNNINNIIIIIIIINHCSTLTNTLCMVTQINSKS